jgi:predicted MPP superfamily phosphohydrolase
MIYCILFCALFGHTVLAVGTLNRMHAGRWTYQALAWLDVVWLLWMLAFVAVWCAILQACWGADASRVRWPPSATPARALQIGMAYLLFCSVVAGTVLPWWLWRQWQLRDSSRLLSNHTTVVDVGARLQKLPCGTLASAILARVPGNEIMQVHLQQKRVHLPQLPPNLQGLTITHLSDLHFTGQLTADFFRVIVAEANAFGSDLVVLTGDIIDHQRCLPWLGDVLGKLKAPEGVYFILGNHDLRVRNEVAVRRELTAAGLVDLGGTGRTVVIRNEPLWMAGNELPWFPWKDSSAVASRACFSVLLAHTPDQFPWARTHGYHLCLAGHTHGGQIRLPKLGAILCPSRFGARYASGTFYEPPTLMHVSRGVSGTRQSRYNCPPEVTQLILTRSTTG